MMQHKIFQGINHMGICAPWADYKNKQFFTNIKIKQTTLRYNTEYLKEINPMALCVPWDDTYLHNYKFE